MLLYKNLNQGISDVDVKKGIVTGYFSSFDNMDSDGDVIRKGAFTKTSPPLFAFAFQNGKIFPTSIPTL